MALRKPFTSASNLQTTVNNLQTTANTNSTNISNLQSTVNSLQTSVNTNTTNINTLLSTQFFKDYSLSHKVGEYKSHGWGHGATSTGVGAPNTPAMDAFPFLVVDNSIVCDKMGVAVSSVATQGTNNTILGIYTDSNGYPGNLIAQTPIIDVSTTGWKEAAFIGGDVTLNRGLYWIVRLSGGNTSFNGLSASHSLPVNLGMAVADSTYDQTNTGVGTHGIRFNYGAWPGNLPSSFPSIVSGAKWLSRTQYCSPWIRRKA